MHRCRHKGIGVADHLTGFDFILFCHQRPADSANVLAQQHCYLFWTRQELNRTVFAEVLVLARMNATREG
jgi:hypothetical protein